MLNELSDEPHNAWIKCFASKKKEKKSAFITLNRAGFSAFGTDLKWIVEGLLFYWFNIGGQDMEIELTPEKIMEYGKKWESFVLAGLEPDDMLAKLSVKDRLKGLTPKERLEGLGLKERLEGLSPEEIEEYLLKLKMNRSI